MTTDEIVEYYADLLIIQYHEQPKAFATIETLVRPMIMDQMPVAVQNAFDIDSAVGVQLDILGKYTGVTRTGYGTTGPITLDDDNFRTFIKFAVIINNAGSSLYDIQNALFQFFPGLILVTDFKNMRLSYLISTAIGSPDLIQLIINEGYLPKPMGVELAIVIYTPTIDSFFGFRTYTLPGINNSPFNTYEDYQFTWPWLDYHDGLGPLIQLAAENGTLLTQENGDAIYIG